MIKRPESATLDFKEQSYSFKKGDPDEDAKFIKDILSFCNTIRDEEAYIIAGISHTPQQTDLVGLSDFTDDAIFQQKAKDKIWPKAVFKSYTYQYEGKLFGIIEFPIHHYPSPLEATRQMKGILTDTIYLRRGSGNAAASPRETIQLHQWQQSIPPPAEAQKPGINIDQAELDRLIAELSDRSKSLAATMAAMHAFAGKANDKNLLQFTTHELKGYHGLKDGKMTKYKFRIRRIIATPYEIQLAPWGSAEQMLEKLRNDEHFRDVDYFFNNSLVDLEVMQGNMKSKPTLALLSVPYQKVFPTITASNVPKATLYLGPQDIDTVYEGIRKFAIKQLIDLNK